jgi:tetratricopeptide (TPR) repeat protein
MLERLQRARVHREQIVWEAGFVLIGFGLIGFTLHLYSGFETAHPAAKFHSSPSGADRQIDAAQDYLTSHPDDINANIGVGMAFYQKGPERYVDAMNALDKARSLGATDDNLFFYSGVIYETLGLPDYAINEFAKFLRHHPNDYETTLRLANLYFRQKRIDEAQALYKEAIHAWPKDATAWFNYAMISKEKGEYDLALQSLEKVTDITGRLPAGGLYQEGEIYRLKGDSAKAMQLYGQELARYPNYIPALESTELIIRAKGDLKQSRMLKKRIAELKKQVQQAAVSASTPSASTKPNS